MSTCPPPFSAEWIKQQWAAVEDQKPMNSPDALIRQWQDESARLDKEAARVRAAGEGGSYQVHGWETRAAALRDCAVELWQALTEDADA